MNNRWYVFTIKITSNGSEERELQHYDDHDTAIRKFHEAFNVIGGGPRYIAATVLDRSMNQDDNHTETWTNESAPEPNA